MSEVDTEKPSFLITILLNQQLLPKKKGGELFKLPRKETSTWKIKTYNLLDPPGAKGFAEGHPPKIRRQFSWLLDNCTFDFTAGPVALVMVDN